MNVALFIIFFGAALGEAMIGHHWLFAGVYLLLGLLSFTADVHKAQKTRRE